MIPKTFPDVCLCRSYHEAHEGREEKNLEASKRIFVHLRALRGDG